MGYLQDKLDQNNKILRFHARVKELEELRDQKIKQMEFLTVNGNNMRERIKELEDALENFTNGIERYKETGGIWPDIYSFTQWTAQGLIALNRSKETK